MNEEHLSENKQKVYIRTFGCQMNEYDSLKLGKILEPGYVQVQHPNDADLVLINTCSVRGKPEHKLYSLLGEVSQLKRSNPNLMIGVGGCVAQQEGESIVKRSKEVDFVFGTHNLSLVPSLIEDRKSGLKAQVAIDYRDEWEDLPLGFTEENRTTAFVSISRGCNKNCSYCIVPTTRGKEVSRDIAEILREVKILCHRGAKEIVLLGQTVNSYGLDLTPRKSFVSLLEAVADVPQVQRIRFTSPHPQEVRSDFIELVCSNPKVCRHIHMPLQSGNDRILKLMNRNYRRTKFLRIIEDLKTRVPDMAVTTDIIVGFPGETEEEFLDTLDVMNQVEFESSYSFIFSPRPGTAAAEMTDEVSYDKKLERLQRLQARQQELTTQKLETWIGKEVDVLIDGYSSADSTLARGRLSQNIVLNMLSPVKGAIPGKTARVLVTSAAKNTLKGNFVDFVEPFVH